jgi:3-oxoadipate enol-lactonase
MQPLEFEIRRAQPSDADAIAVAHRESIRSIGPRFYPASIVDDWAAGLTSDVYIKAMQGGEVFFIAAAEVDGEPAVLGFATHRIDDGRHGTSVYVRGVAARRGIGSALFRVAEAHAIAGGAPSIQIEASLAGVEFYKVHGFEEIARGETRLRSGRPIGCVFMRKTLTKALPRASGEAAVRGTRLYYEVAGAGPPVVLVSGGGTLDRRQWDDQFDALAAQYLVIRYDIRGIGRSARPTGGFSHHEDLRALLEFLGIERAVVCGVSFGAAIACDFALDHGNMTAGLVLGATALSSDKSQSVEGVLTLTALAKKEGLERAIDLITGMPSFVSPGSQSARRRMREIYLENRDVFESGFPLVTLWQPTRPPATERLPAINTPVLIVAGENDFPGTAAAANRLACTIAGARKVVIAGAAHMVNMDAGAEFTRVLLAFLRDAYRGSRSS